MKVFRLDLGDATSDQNLIEVGIKEAKGRPGEPFLEIELIADGEGEVIVRLDVPGSAGLADHD